MRGWGWGLPPKAKEDQEEKGRRAKLPRIARDPDLPSHIVPEGSSETIHIACEWSHMVACSSPCLPLSGSPPLVLRRLPPSRLASPDPFFLDFETNYQVFNYQTRETGEGKSRMELGAWKSSEEQ